MTITIGYVLAALIAAAIIVIGTRFLVAPRAAAGYGVPSNLSQQDARAYLSVKGVRGIASGLFVLIVMVAGPMHLLGWIMLTATMISLADTAIVLRGGGPKSVTWGVHGVTAAVMFATSALLLP